MTMTRYEDLKHKDSRRRSYNYKKLKEAGFNSYEATRFKDFSTAKIVSLIAKRNEYNASLKVLAGDEVA